MREIGGELRRKRNSDIADYYEKLAQLDSKNLGDKIKEYVIGQDAFIERFMPQFAAMVSRMMLSIEGEDESNLPRLSAACVIGPTASGKTYFFKTLSKASDIPMQMVDCASLTGAGWKGGDVEKEFVKIATLQQEYPCMPLMVIWDEADKMRYHKGAHYDSSSSAQYALLKYLDGGTYQFAYDNKNYSIDTRFVINIFLGAFTGIEDYVGQRLKKPSFGFTADHSEVDERQAIDWREHVTAADLEEWGMFKEFCGRIGPIEAIPALGEDDLVRIVRNGKHSLLEKYKPLLPPGCGLEITVEAAHLLARQALDSSLGVRALESSFQQIATKAIDGAKRAPASDIVIDAVEDELRYRLSPRESGGLVESKVTNRKTQFNNALTRELEQHSRYQKHPAGNDAKDRRIDLINERFRQRYFDLSYFLDAEQGPERLAKCLASECIDAEDGIPSAFRSSYKETCFALLLHFLCKYDREYRTFGELYRLASWAENRVAFGELLAQSTEGLEPPADFEASWHLHTARSMMREMENVSREAFWNEAESLVAQLIMCAYRQSYVNDIVNRIYREFPAKADMRRGSISKTSSSRHRSEKKNGGV